MDFHSLLRRDLQFLCKRNKIPANMTNLAMADALKSLEIVEGLDEYMIQSPTSVARQPPSAATRTTRRKTAVKAEPQLSSQLVNPSKSLDGELDQESKTNNVKFEASVAKTPAARTTRKAIAETSCSSKVQSVYSTRRSTRLLEKCMADLSLKTEEALDDKPEKNDETEQKISVQENNPGGSETEVIPGRDLNASMEKEWEVLKSESDQVVEDLELSVGTGHIAVFDANTETNKEMMNEVECDKKESEISLVKVDKDEEETLQAVDELKKNENDQEAGDVEIPVLEYANTETHNDNKESLDSSLLQETEPVIQESEKVSNMDTMVDQTDDDVDLETEPEEDDSGVDSLVKVTEEIQESEKTSNMDTTVDQTDDDSETEPEEDDSGVDSLVQETEEIQESEKISNVDAMVDQTDNDDSETEPEEDDSGVDTEEDTISEADSNQAVLGSDISDEDMILPVTEVSATSPPRLLEETKVKATPPSSPFASGPISVQFPRPSKPETPSKSSSMKLINAEDNNNKENNNLEMMVNGESKGEAKKMKKVEIDEESLRDVSMRQLVKMVKELSIKSGNRTALKMLPGNNQIAE